MTFTTDEPPVLYHDEHLAVVRKPAGLLSVPGIGADKQDCVVARLRELNEGGWTREVHRLDMSTSGLMVLAHTPDAHRALSRQFQQRRVDKQYEAVVAGRVSDDAGEMTWPLRKDMDRPPRHRVDPVQGKPAVTRYRVLERQADHTRLALVPLTGRSHQLRVHLLTLGHPILGDDLYAPPEVRQRSNRLLLHATILGFTHPVDERAMRFEDVPPF